MMNPAPGSGIDPRVEFIAGRLQQIQQMQEMMGRAGTGGQGGHGHSHGGQGGQGGHGHSHGGQPCDWHGHDMGQMGSVLARMQAFIQVQAQGGEGGQAAGSQNQAKAMQVLEMIEKMQQNIGVGSTVKPVEPATQQEEHREPDSSEDQKLALLAGDIAANAPHRQKNWIAYTGSESTGPQESFLQGGGHFTPPVFGWGELVKTPQTDDQLPAQKTAKDSGTKSDVGIKMPHETDSSGGVILKTLPIVGRIRFLTDIQGLCFWSIVVLYWIMGNFSSWFCILLPQFYDGNLSMIWLVDHPDWSYCHQCNRKRPPRAHHCRRCKQCVMKMDHHCPWINNCVGEANQWAFVLLITYAQLLSLYTLALNLLWYWRMPPCQLCDPASFAIFHQRALINTVTVLAVLMILFSMGLLCSQHMSVMLDFTTLEWMQLERSVSASGKVPDASDMPRVKKNIFRSYRALCGDTLFIFWPFPCRRRVAPILTKKEDV